jgi:small-conductance mechanosensitive channel
MTDIGSRRDPGARAARNLGHRPARTYVLRAVAAGLTALVGLVLADRLGGLDVRVGLRGDEAVLTIVGAALVLLGGIACVRWSARATRVAMVERAGEGRAAVVSLLTRVVGYVLVGLAALSALEVDLGNLLLGGAVTGIVVGIAAQQVLANFFAGIVLLVVRPFEVGQHLALRSGAVGAEYAGLVSDMSAFYVRLETVNGPVSLPNASVLAAAVGPGALTTTPAADDENQADEGDQDEGDQDEPERFEPAADPGSHDPADPNR